jgi:hypothetical protein
MRLSERTTRTVTVKPAAARAVYREDDRLYRFDDGLAFVIRAAILPMTEQSAASVYGETPGTLLLMLYSGGETLEEGMGVCVDAAGSAPCDYRVAEMPKRYPGHVEITLAFIPPEMRG